MSKTVVISAHFEASDAIADIVSRLGYDVAFTDCHWPRDEWVEHNGKIALPKNHNIASEGGLFVYDQFGGSLAFASTNGIDPGLDSIQRYFGVTYKRIVPNLHPNHIDSNALIATPYVFTDKNCYNYEKNQPVFDSIKGYKLVVADIGEEWQLKPLNCLVLNFNGKPFLIANSNTPKFLEELEKHGVRFVDVSAYDSPIYGEGSINCRTNIISDLSLLTRENGFRYNIWK